jgi:hypothetical protein
MKNNMVEKNKNRHSNILFTFSNIDDRDVTTHELCVRLKAFFQESGNAETLVRLIGATETHKSGKPHSHIYVEWKTQTGPRKDKEEGRWNLYDEVRKAFEEFEGRAINISPGRAGSTRKLEYATKHVADGDEPDYVWPHGVDWRVATIVTKLRGKKTWRDVLEDEDMHPALLSKYGNLKNIWEDWRQYDTTARWIATSDDVDTDNVPDVPRDWKPVLQWIYDIINNGCHHKMKQLCLVGTAQTGKTSTAYMIADILKLSVWAKPSRPGDYSMLLPSHQLLVHDEFDPAAYPDWNTCKRFLEGSLLPIDRKYRPIMERAAAQPMILTCNVVPLECMERPDEWLSRVTVAVISDQWVGREHALRFFLSAKGKEVAEKDMGIN